MFHGTGETIIFLRVAVVKQGRVSAAGHFRKPGKTGVILREGRWNWKEKKSIGSELMTIVGSLEPGTFEDMGGTQQNGTCVPRFEGWADIVGSSEGRLYAQFPTSAMGISSWHLCSKSTCQCPSGNYHWVAKPAGLFEERLASFCSDILKCFCNCILPLFIDRRLWNSGGFGDEQRPQGLRQLEMAMETIRSNRDHEASTGHSLNPTLLTTWLVRKEMNKVREMGKCI